MHSSEQLKGTPEFYSGTLRPFAPSPPSMGPSTSGTSSEFGGDDEDNDEEDDEIQFRQRHRRKGVESTSSWHQSVLRRMKFRVVNLLGKVYAFMTVPLWASLFSLIVACIPPLQHALDEHVQPIKGALTMAGNCSIPVTLVVLGAYFYTPPDPAERASRRTLPSTTNTRERSVSSTSHMSIFDNVRDMFSMKKRSRDGRSSGVATTLKRPGETKTVIVAVLARMIVTPLLLLPLLALLMSMNLQEVFDE